jgi:lipopolysaccharide transport system ATP-binding protein
MKPHIEVRELSKAYTIGHDIVSYRALRDELSMAIRHPLRSIRGHKRETEELWALRDVTFDVAEGDVLGVIGRNGSGKSTLLKILSRIVEPTAGRVVLRGRVSSLLEVGTGFHAELTGRENVFLNGALLGMSRREISSKFDEIVAFSEIERFLDTPVKFYSSGMYVRLAFAVAAHLDPDVLIVDEVLAVGDAAFQQKSLGKMSSVASDGRTVLFVSHNAQSVLELCTRGIHLSSGRLVAIGTAVEALDSYRGEIDAARERDVNVHGRERGGAYITRIDVRDAEGDAPLMLDSGEPIVFELHAEVAPEMADRGLQVQFTIDTEGGVRVFTAHSSWANTPIVASDGTITVRCMIEEPHLAPGRFFVSGWVSASGEYLDHLERAATFEIAPAAEFLDPKRIPAYGPVDFPHRFEQVAQAEAAAVGKPSPDS